MEKHIYRYLKGLKGSDFQIVDGEPNIIGWEVKSDTGSYIGEITDLLFDPESRSVRYLVIDLDDNGMDLGDKKVMVPIGTAHLHTSDDEVVLPNISSQHLSELPAYDEDATVPATEVQVAQVFNTENVDRNETQRERAIAEFNQSEFYQHEHFNKDRFYQRGGINSQPASENTGTVLTKEQYVGDDFVDNSKRHDHHAAEPEIGTDTYYNDTKPEGDDDSGYQHKNKPPYQ